MWQSLIAPVLAIIDKIIPDPAAREAAKLQLMQAEGQQALQEMQQSLSAILAEAQSNDAWTSRARPSFLYVIYVLLLTSLPMGVLFACDPAVASAVTQGFHDWLAAIPEPLISLFSVGYLGYTGARSLEKMRKK